MGSETSASEDRSGASGSRGMGSELIREDAVTLATRIAAKEVSSTEVTQAHLDQIAATDERYHAFLHVGAEQALAAAFLVTLGVGGEGLVGDPCRVDRPKYSCPAPPYLCRQ